MKRSLTGLLIGFALCLILVVFAGESPSHVVWTIFDSAFGSSEDLMQTLFYTTSLIFTGLSFCVAFQAGLFNIGAEGQLTVACLATTAAGLTFTKLFPTSTTTAELGLSFVAAVCGLAAGALWGFIPGFFKVKREAHEVIVTMMMNFIAAGIAAWYVTAHQNPDSQNPESAPLSTSLGWVTDSYFNVAFLIALLTAVTFGWFLYKSRWGFHLRATGLGEEAAKYNGIHTARMKMAAMTWAGVFAGGVALNEILGSQLKYRLGFSPNYGFIGVAVAMLARNNPFGIILSAFLFAVIQKGSGDLDLETAVITRDFAKILQAVLILSVSAASLWSVKKRGWPWKKS